MSETCDNEILIAGLLDQYLTLEEDEPSNEPSSETLENNTDQKNQSSSASPSATPAARIPYPATALAPAADTVAKLFSSLTPTNELSALAQHQLVSIKDTEKITLSLRSANELLRTKYPSFNADIERCQELFKKIQMDRVIIEESIRRSQTLLRAAGHN